MGSVERYNRNRLNRLAKRMREEEDIREKLRLAIIIYRTCYRGMHKDGGPGSGNWGHKGRPGEVGGSATGSGGKENRITTKSGSFTSASQVKKTLAKPHQTSTAELKSLPSGSIVRPGDGSAYEFYREKNGDLSIHICDEFGDDYIYISPKEMNDELAYFNDFESTEIAIPDLSVAEASGLADTNYVRSVLNPGETDTELHQQFNDAFRATEPQQYDEKNREQAGELWNSLDDETKSSIYNYTQSGYTDINDTLRGTRDHWSQEKWNELNSDIDGITSAIDRSELKEDTILFRGISKSSCEKLFGLDEGTLSPESLDTLNGRVGTDDAYSSAGSAENKGSPESQVMLQILAPSGTKALYTEPFSAYGAGSGENWDGTSSQTRYSEEFETVIQRGTTYKVISANYGLTPKGKRQYKLQVAIVNQDYTTSEYSKNRAQNS